ncbi:MAG: hypothetical protein RLN59_01660, partial [Haliea sp.]
MFSRRNFLVGSSMLAASGAALCSPPAAVGLAPAAAAAPLGSVADANAQSYVRSRREWLQHHDPKVFLGYPAN